MLSKISAGSRLSMVAGYLYALSHGAKIIYETVDDFHSTDGLLGFKRFRLDGLVPNCGVRFFRPSLFYGQLGGASLNAQEKCDYSTFNQDKVSILCKRSIYRMIL